MKLAQHSHVFKIAIVRLSSLGDVIVGACALPFIRTTLEQMYPQGVSITWVVDSVFAQVLQNSPCIENLTIISLKKEGIKALPIIVRELAQIGYYDKVIDMQGLIKSALCARLIKGREYWGFAWDSIKEPVASLCYTKKVHMAYSEHILKRNMHLLCAAFNIPYNQAYDYYASRGSAFGVDKDASARVKEVFIESIPPDSIKSHKTQYVLLVLESSLESKSYPVSLFAEVIEQLCVHRHIYILLLWHNSNKAKILKTSFANVHNVVLLPHLNLNEVKALMQKIDVTIGGDTGITHLAWAMQRASLTLYGNTPPKRFALNGEHNRFLCGSENPNYKKDDFSIAHILPSAVYESAMMILQDVGQSKICSDIQ
ncbi:lipopolysaccharide heptosyltransferase I [Helicobacter jaachi]|uniref:Lipopolysaccharide heptosyltransferase 1 n=1 Tax=Helicobacter jaachi TaxID=1677920 RepID=A0A4U8T991_9HELI|nr:lipopolysaccharide heptosyltransferase I [Helicobacter jaachi]TLD96285.1 lipopolysaccharide heptosyltransferase I [Helicobacter jaachi]